MSFFVEINVIPTKAAMFRFLAITLFLLSTLTVSATDIELRRQANPMSSVVRLGDVAEVKTSDLVERDRLSAIPLMPTPSQGAVQYLRAQSVRDLLRANGEDLNDLRFSGASSIKIGAPQETTRRFASEDNPGQWDPVMVPEEQGSGRRKQVTGYRLDEPKQTAKPVSRVPNRRELLSAQQNVREAIEAWLTTQGEAGKMLAIGEIQVDPIDLNRLHQYRSRELVAEPMGYTSATPGSGRFMVAPLEGEPSYASAELIGLKQIVMSAQNLARGEVITAARVSIKGILPQELNKERGRPYTTLESVVGRIASRSIRTGDLLTDANLTTPLLVRRGEAVTVATGSNGITVRMQAVAKADGRQGDLVLVETIEKQEQFQARVTGRSQLAVLSAGAFNAQLATGASVGVIR